MGAAYPQLREREENSMAAPELPVEKRSLHVPDLEELCRVLQEGLSTNFENVAVQTVECPDLTQRPFTLAAQGICGSPRLADVGGVPYLVPLAQRDKVYNFDSVARSVDLPGAFIIGAGAGQCASVNCELMPNIVTSSDCTHGNNQSRAAMICPDDGILMVKKYPKNEFYILGNLFASEGKTGQVIEVKVKKRTGDTNFVTNMRETLKAYYGEKPVGLGGTFLIESGNAKLHVMPDYSLVPLNSDADVNNWLKFREAESPLVCLSVLISHDPGLSLRVEHTHCFNQFFEGGHYHYDTTPNEVSYRGYFVPAEYIYRLDRPPP